MLAVAGIVTLAVFFHKGHYAKPECSNKPNDIEIEADGDYISLNLQFVHCYHKLNLMFLPSRRARAKSNHVNPTRLMQ